MILRRLSGLAIGAGAALVGLLPWLLTGARLPIQNLWATAVTDSAAMPLVLLPFSQYAVLNIVSLLLTGSAAAGLGARRLPGRRIGVAIGLLAVQLIAIVQSALADGGGLQHTALARLYLGLLVGVAVVSLALGVAVLLLIALARPAGLVVGVAVAAVPFGAWVDSVLVPLGSVSVPPVTAALLVASRFVPAVVIGSAIAWAGVRSIGRALAAIVALLVLWLGPALETAVVSSAGTRAYAHDPAAMLEAGRTVFRLAVLSADLVVPALVVALAVVLLGTVGRVLVTGRRKAVTPG